MICSSRKPLRSMAELRQVAAALTSPTYEVNVRYPNVQRIWTKSIGWTITGAPAVTATEVMATFRRPPQRLFDEPLPEELHESLGG